MRHGLSERVGTVDILEAFLEGPAKKWFVHASSLGHSFARAFCLGGRGHVSR